MLCQTQRLGQGRQVATQVDWRVSEDEQQGRVVGLMAPGVFHGQARFTYAAKAVDRLAGNDGCGSTGGSGELLVQVGQKCLASLEVGTQAEVRKILRLAGYCSRLGKADRGNFVAQVLQRAERLALVWTLPEPVAVLLLQLAQLRRLLLVRVERTLGIGQKHVDGFVECLGDLELQLRIGTAWGARRAVFRLLAIGEPYQADNGVAGVDLLPQDVQQLLIVTLKVVLHNRMHTPLQQNIAYGSTITAQVDRGGADEHIRAFLHHMAPGGVSWE